MKRLSPPLAEGRQTPWEEKRQRPTYIQLNPRKDDEVIKDDRDDCILRRAYMCKSQRLHNKQIDDKQNDAKQAAFTQRIDQRAVPLSHLQVQESSQL